MSSQQSSRGSWARGDRRGASQMRARGWRGGFHARTSTQPSTPPLPFGETIDQINVTTILVDNVSPKIGDVKYVTSYNWLDDKVPTILVPGSPPAWTPPAIDAQLEPDSDDVYRDINAARYPAYHMEPSIRSVLALQPRFDVRSLDIVACGSTIGSLLRSAGAHSTSFRFDVDVLGDTVFFIRRESSPTAIIPDLNGWNHRFVHTYTTWDADVRGSCSHQRLVQYKFGELNVLIRTEGDAYIKEAAAEVTTQIEPSKNSQPLEIVLEGMAVSSQGHGQSNKLKVKMQGRMVPQDKIFDIKTRSSWKTYDMGEILPRLWANQTPNFLIAYHQTGLFSKPATTRVSQAILDWEEENLPLLARLHALLKRITDVVRDSDGPFEVSGDGEGPVLITKQTGEARHALPSDLVGLWDDTL